ncbi:phosphatase PAP2 family protein [Aliihoeflea sp. 40Bstr573]|uniref:phosphatase PAP2 family protein n=1 Tax=Aliihoeflea sp. 40Bstr573 TaxID=2696467 RepID=UPI002095E4A4|nr:phosphatase PAP2 family protein [Aliihoeflea sp. 40Bstr573]
MNRSITELVRGMRDHRTAFLPLIVFAIAAAGIALFLSIADELDDGELNDIDERIFLWFHTPGGSPIGPEWLQETAAEITALGGYTVILVLVAAVIGFLVVSRKNGPALYTVLSIGTGTLVGHLLKELYARPRPDLVEHLVNTHTPSFPSGHAMVSAIVYLTLGSLIMRFVDNLRVRAYVLAVAITLTLMIGISRIYLGVHWPSDVVAGWAMGAAWASLAWLTVSALRLYRRRRGGQAEAPDSSSRIGQSGRASP